LSASGLPLTGPWLLYGANGYTGELIARHALGRGHRPILGGRSDAVASLARELGLEHRIFSLEDPVRIEIGLDGMSLVLHCAGPFVTTFRPMAEACLRTRTHYLDITGEIAVFEALVARDAEARAAGTILLPGCGFDVVPSDCLAAHIKRRLPSARRLVLAFDSGGGISRGTAMTALGRIDRGGLVRRGGVLTPVPSAWRTRRIDLGRGPRTAVSLPWGDVATAWHTTGIPDIEVYMAMPRALRLAVVATRALGPLLRRGPVHSVLQAWVRSRPPGPSAERRRRARGYVWAEAEDEARRRVVSRLVTPEGYTLTALAAVAIVERVLAGKAPTGYQTPATAYGPDFVLELPGVARTDVE
jgi:short subunit dehydrogenase-like uncharacterized protein